MTQEKPAGGRFASLRALREQRTEEPLESQESLEAQEVLEPQELPELQEVPEPQELLQEQEIEQASLLQTDVTDKTEKGLKEIPEATKLQPVVAKKTKSNLPQKNKTVPQDEKRGPGRPAGRRSNPDYTQISAYIPLDMLLEVQDVLAEERKELRKRTPRPVSDLVEELLGTWLKKQKSSKSDR
jgi:hypothetical protein